MSLYNKLLKYLYSWYTIPIIYLHEISHYLVSKILNVKVLKFKIFKDDKYLIYNGIVITELPTKKWKQFLISYSPLFLLSLTLNIYILIYIITSTIYYQKHLINIILPSKSDIDTYKSYDYNKYLLEKLKDDYYIYLLNGNLADKIKSKCLLSKKDFYEHYL